MSPVDRIRGEIDNVQDYISGARSALDELWHHLEDATAPKGKHVWTRQTNKRSGREAVYDLLQNLRAAESHLQDARKELRDAEKGVAREPTPPKPGPKRKPEAIVPPGVPGAVIIQFRRPDPGPYVGGPTA